MGAPSISPQLSQRRQQAISSPNSQLSPQFNSQRIHQAHPNSPQSPQQFHHPGTEFQQQVYVNPHQQMLRRAAHMDGKPRPISAPNFGSPYFENNTNSHVFDFEFPEQNPQCDIKPFLTTNQYHSGVDPSSSPFSHANNLYFK